MNTILSIGLLIFTGYILGALAKKIKLPKISGYILAGIILNPDLLGIVSVQFVEQTDPLLTVSLSLITFSIGGSLLYSKLKSSGKIVLLLTVFESLSAFIFVFLLMFLSLYFFMPVLKSLASIITISLLLASLAAPTDPSATLAVIHEYKAKGVVSNAMLEIAAFDDMTGITIYTIVSVFASTFIGKGPIELSQIFIELTRGIGGAILIGVILGLVFNYIVKILDKQSEGTLIVLTFSLVFLSYGISEILDFEALISTMALGAMVINFNPLSEKIFKLIERYTDELIFVVFFSLSGLHLKLEAISGGFLLILIYILARMLGKFSGIYLGASLFKTDPKIKKYASGGLIPQGGIVIGLALLLAKEPAFEQISSLIIGVVIGAALLHEIFGPIASKWSLKKADELT